MGKILPCLKQQLQDQQLQITLGPLTTAIIEAITEGKCIDPRAWIMLQISKSINENWDWEENKPKKKSKTIDSDGGR